MRRPAAALLVTAAALLAGCGEDAPHWGLPEPASEEGEQIRDLWQGFFIAALVVAGIVYGLLVYVLVRYRRRNDDVPRQNPYNIRIEVLYTVLPILTVAGLFAASQTVENDITETTDEPAVQVEVVGFQWQWRFTYPDADVTIIGTPEGGRPELVLPVGVPTRFDLVAHDVNHSFWVPGFLEKRDLIPGVDNEIDITPTRTGTFVGRCAEFCGLDHWRMGFTVRVVDGSEFEDWLQEQADG